MSFPLVPRHYKSRHCVTDVLRHGNGSIYSSRTIWAVIRSMNGIIGLTIITIVRLGYMSACWYNMREVQRTLTRSWPGGSS